MNNLWDIRIFLGLVPKESHCIKSYVGIQYFGGIGVESFKQFHLAQETDQMAWFYEYGEKYSGSLKGAVLYGRTEIGSF